MFTQNSLEGRAISNFISHQENTMHAVVTSSVGAILRRLAEEYFHKDIDSFLPDEIDLLYKECEEQLKIVAASSVYAEKWQSLIAYLNSKVSEKLDRKLDSFTIYDPQSTESDHKRKYVISLKLVSVLVWYAIQDNSAYIHHFQDEENPLEKSEADRKHREASWFENLARLKADPVCHQGARNSFVFLLNKAYKDVEIIEDARLFVYQYLKEAIFKTFLKVYRNCQNPDIFKPGLISWMTQDDPSMLLAQLGKDVKENILQGINNVFIKHGSDPSEKQIVDVVEKACTELQFYCDDQLLPHLAIMYQIFHLKATIHSPIGRQVIASVHTWMHDAPQLENNETTPYLIIFHQIYTSYQVLVRSRSYLELNDKFNEAMRSYVDAAEIYFQKVIDVGIKCMPPFNVNELISYIEREILPLNANELDGAIENFFAIWSASSRKTQQEIYQSLLLNPAFKQIVILSDEAILSLFSQDNSTEVKLTPYEINRFFLHALMVRANQWTETFYHHFSSILAFVENNFNGSEIFTSHNLKYSSYSDKLLIQFRYLKAKYDDVDFLDKKNQFYNYRNFPDIVILPEQIKESFEIAVLYNFFQNAKDVYAKIYRSFRIYFENVLCHSSDEVSYLVPEEYLVSFAAKYYRLENNIHGGLTSLAALMGRLSHEKCFAVLQAMPEQLDALFVNGKWQTALNIFRKLSAESREWLVNLLKAETLIKMIPNWHTLREYISLLSKVCVALLFNKLQPDSNQVGTFNRIFTNINDVYWIFQTLDPMHWELFYNKWARQRYVSDERKVQGVYSPSCLLDVAIKAQYLPLVYFLLKKQVPFEQPTIFTTHILLKACVELKDASLAKYFDANFALITTLLECTTDAVELEKIKKCYKQFFKLFLNDLSLHIQFRILQENNLRELIKIKWQINFLLKIDIEYIERFPEVFDATFCALIQKERQAQLTCSCLNQRQKAKYILKRGDLLKIEGLTYFERAEILVELYVSDHRSLPRKHLRAITACLKSTNAAAIIALNDARAAELIFLSRCVESLSIYDKMNIIRKWQHDTVFINSLSQTPIANLYQPYSNILSFTKSQVGFFSDDKKFLRSLSNRPADSDLSHLINHFHHTEQKLSVWLQEVPTNSTFQLHAVKLSAISLEHNNRLDNVRQSALSTQDENGALLLIYDASIKALLNLLERVSANCSQHAARLYIGQMRKTLTFALESYSEIREENVFKFRAK